MEGVPTWHQTFASVLNEKDAEFISYGEKSQNLKNNFEGFINLVHEKERIGDIFKLI